MFIEFTWLKNYFPHAGDNEFQQFQYFNVYFLHFKLKAVSCHY